MEVAIKINGTKESGGLRRDKEFKKKKQERERRARLAAPRKRRTTRYSQSDLEFFDRVEDLYKLTKAQLIEHIIALENSLEHLQ